MDILMRLAANLGPWAIVLVVLAVVVLPQSIRILREYERGVIFRLGKLQGAKGPGLIFLIPIQTEPWGVKVTSVEVKEVALPESMKRAMAKQAEAERERRAKVVNAEGEFQAAEKMVQAAAMIAKEPIALQLRYLQTMREMASEHNTTTFLPLPIDMFSAFLKK